MTPSPGNLAVAEHAVALMLAVGRRLLPAHAGTVRGAYRERGLVPATTSEVNHAFQWLGLQGISRLGGKRVGLVGLGDIGQAVARMLRGFDAEVCYYRRTRLAPQAERALGVEFMELDRLVSSVDYLSLHLPHTPETNQLLDGPRLRSMKPPWWRRCGTATWRAPASMSSCRSRSPLTTRCWAWRMWCSRPTLEPPRPAGWARCWLC